MAFVNSVVIDRSDRWAHQQHAQEQLPSSSCYEHSDFEHHSMMKHTHLTHDQHVSPYNHQQNTHSCLSDTKDDQSSTAAIPSSVSFSTNDALIGTLKPLYRYCLSLTRSEWDAQDLVQDTLLRAWQRQTSEGIDISQYQEAYLIRMARNLWTDNRRRQTVLQHKLQWLGGTLEQTETGNLAQQQLEAELAIQQLLNVLSPLQHVVYVLRELLNYTAAETAHRLHTSEGAVKSALKRARIALDRCRQNAEMQTDNALHPTTDAAKYNPSDAVKHSSKKPAFSAANIQTDPQNSSLLRDYLAAFRNGQTDELIQLILNTAADPTALAPVVIGQLTRTPSDKRANVTPSMRTQAMKSRFESMRYAYSQYRYSA
ncbi:RNA polymerase sigma factor [Paenibacillus kandeliae]|uniref:RNA polymerase sigma factor n=1 Tax=Paenibacillus kandeliae TaxID=3231269 RepID=UPI00345A2DB3